jgi:inhibitor of cysteine peptidase
MKQEKMTHRCFKSAIVIAFAGLLLGFLGAGAAQAQAKNDPVPARWEYRLDTGGDAALPDAAQLNGNGVTARLQALGGPKYRLTMSGSRGVEQARQALYSPLVAGFIDGVAEIEIRLPVSRLQKLTLNLQSNLTTGYYWKVASAAGFTQVGQATFTHSSGYGAPSVQTLVFQPDKTGDGSIQLAYRRSFGPQEIATRRLRLDLAAQVAVIDLSNPAAKFIDKLTNDLFAPQNPTEELPLSAALPASFDWRTAGIVPAVRDQGNWGTCWAFGTVGVMESAIKKAGGPMTNLSEQFLVSCNTVGWDGIDGGYTAHYWHYNTLGKHQTAIGAVLEADKPYSSPTGACTVAYKHPYRLSGWAFITGSEDTMPTVNQIKTAIYTYGPVTAGICADQRFDDYSGGVFIPTANRCSGSTNHQIILVGWNDATSSWILRNSYGPYWGENGYMRIQWDTTGATSRVGEGTSWVRWNSPTVPVIKAPIGATTDTTPTYTWSKISGATQYRYRLLNGATLVYTKTVTSGVCGTTLCSSTPATRLGYLTYKWQVQALVGGAWKTYSAYKTFSVSK